MIAKGAGTLAAATAVALSLADCAHSDTTDRNASPSVVCAAIGGAFTEETGEHALYTADDGSCTDKITVSWFAGPAQRDQWLAVARGFGGAFLVGGRWILSADVGHLRPAQAKIGGKLIS